MASAAVSEVSKIPGEFYMPPDPHPCKDLDQAPVIDISDLQSAGSKEKVLQGLREACESWGFFQLLGHGVPTELMEEMMKLAYAFFDQPLEDKLAYYEEDVTAEVGFSSNFEPSKRRQIVTWQEYFFQTCSPPCETSKLPANPARYREVSATYGRKINTLAKQLLQLLSESLGLEASELERRFDGELLFMRLNHYPPCPEPDRAVGIQPHSDINAFTILQQDTEGLQVLHDGAWVTLRPLPHALVVNVGDQLQILSNDRFRSVEHRGVLNSERSRVSIACFYGPSLHARIRPVPGLVSRESPPKYRESCYGEYAKASLSRDLSTIV